MRYDEYTAPNDHFSHELWRSAKARYPIGSSLTGTVVHQAPFGVFLHLDVGHVHAVLEIGCFADAPDYEPGLPLSLGPRLALRYPELGEVVTATVLGHREDNHQIYVSAKPTPTGN
jgi:ribosomal protein S1